METSEAAYQRHQVFIGGGWVTPSGGATLEVISPSTEKVVGEAATASAADVDLAVRHARSALNATQWRNTTLDDRIAILERAADLLEPHTAAIAQVLTAEMGMPISVSMGHVSASISIFREYPKYARQLTLQELRRSGPSNALVLREPVGVVASITPWNGPLFVAVSKIASALLMGCTVVCKPSPETPLDAYFLAEALSEAGLPDGVLNVIAGAAETGEALVAHPDVDMVSFTGSTAIGSKIGSVCGGAMKRMVLELGGKSPAIVLDDADVDSTISVLMGATFFLTGQVCKSLTRIYVPDSLHDDVLDALVARASALVVGDPFEAVTEVGPLVSAGQRKRVERYVDIGATEGARLASGGTRPANLDVGYYVEPTIFDDVTQNMTIAREEIFGPVVSILRYADVEQAVSWANDTQFGLNGSVFSGDPQRALDVARQIRTGAFAVNGYYGNPTAPWGGVKQSGIGREYGPEGIASYGEYKVVNLPSEIADAVAEGRAVW